MAGYRWRMETCCAILRASAIALCFTSVALRGGEVSQDPFGPPPEKKGAELGQCANGHSTLKDVPIVYGLPGPELAAKAAHGDIILGGCIRVPRDHWVVCKSCGLTYDDDFGAWREDHLPKRFAEETIPPCTPETLRRVLSKVFQGFPLEIGGTKPTITSCWRWHDARGIVGESAYYETKATEADVIAALKAWLPAKEEITFLNPDPAKWQSKSWKWHTSGKSFDLSLQSHDQGDLAVCFEWHDQQNADPAGADKPATKPTEGVSEKKQPSAKPPKDAPR